MNPLLKMRLVGVAIAFAIYAVDQLVKWWVAGPLGLVREHMKIDLLPFFDLYRIHNYGVSMGMFEADSFESRWILVGVTALIALIVTIWMFREKQFGDILGLSLILGGALGNIKDRFEMGYVLDYADFHIGEFRPFLIFNIADAAITIGVLIILARAFLMRDKDDHEVDDLMEGKPAEAAESKQ